MKSPENIDGVTFTQLQQRLIMEVLFRINSGEVTERGLARIVGVSQPQIHNVLKGKRRLQTDLADRLLQKFGLNLLDLLQMDRSLVLSGGFVGVPNAPTPRKGPGREAAAIHGLTRSVG